MTSYVRNYSLSLLPFWGQICHPYGHVTSFIVCSFGFYYYFVLLWPMVCSINTW